MSWFRNSSLTWPQVMCFGILKCGIIPKHVAFIMDGNRRFAMQNNVKKLQGHTKGFDKLSETLQWCLDLGISEVTVYAFSIENFKRSKEEVDDLLNLANQKFEKLLDEMNTLMEKGIKLRVIGDLKLLPEELAKTIFKIEHHTKGNNKAILNVAFAYTARVEITEAMRKIVEGYKSSQLDSCDVNLQLLSQCLYTRDSPSPDMVIRTSGEKRLSDFLLLQSMFSYIHFTDVLWPEFTAWHLISAVFHYQRAYPQLCKVKSQLPSAPLSLRASQFLTVADEDYWKAREIVATS